MCVCVSGKPRTEQRHIVSRIVQANTIFDTFLFVLEGLWFDFEIPGRGRNRSEQHRQRRRCERSVVGLFRKQPMRNSRRKNGYFFIASITHRSKMLLGFGAGVHGKNLLHAPTACLAGAVREYRNRVRHPCSGVHSNERLTGNKTERKSKGHVRECST